MSMIPISLKFYHVVFDKDWFYRRGRDLTISERHHVPNLSSTNNNSMHFYASVQTLGIFRLPIRYVKEVSRNLRIQNVRVLVRPQPGRLVLTLTT